MGLLMSSESQIKDPKSFVLDAIKEDKLVVFSKTYWPYATKAKKLLTDIGATFKVYELNSLGEPRNGPVRVFRVFCFLHPLTLHNHTGSTVLEDDKRRAICSSNLSQRKVHRYIGNDCRTPWKKRITKASERGGRVYSKIVKYHHTNTHTYFARYFLKWRMFENITKLIIVGIHTHAERRRAVVVVVVLGIKIIHNDAMMHEY